MTVRAAVVRDTRDKKVVGLVLHEESTGRVVTKIDPASPLQDALALALAGLPGLSVVVSEPMGTATVRRRVLPRQASYFQVLLERVILAPFVISEIRESHDRIDQAADALFVSVGVAR